MSTAQAQAGISDDFRRDLYTALLSGNGIRNIQDTLEHELQATGFLSNLKAYIAHLFRSGECTTMPEVMKRVEAKIKHDTDAAKGVSNGVNGVNGHSKESDEYDLAMPDKAIQEGHKTVRKEIAEVCDITYAEDK